MFSIFYVLYVEKHRKNIPTIVQGKYSCRILRVFQLRKKGDLEVSDKRKLAKRICGELDLFIKELLLAEKPSTLEVLARIKVKLEGLPDEVAPILFCIYCGRQECNCEFSVYVPKVNFRNMA